VYDSLPSRCLLWAIAEKRDKMSRISKCGHLQHKSLLRASHQVYTKFTFCTRPKGSIAQVSKLTVIQLCSVAIWQPSKTCSCCRTKSRRHSSQGLPTMQCSRSTGSDVDLHHNFRKLAADMFVFVKFAPGFDGHSSGYFTSCIVQVIPQQQPCQGGQTGSQLLAQSGC